MSMAPVLPTPRNQREPQGPMIPQLEQLQQQLNRLGSYKVYTDGGWEYGGEGIDAPFYPPTDTPSHKGGGSIVFLTTNMERIAKSLQRTPFLWRYASKMGKGWDEAQTLKNYWRYWGRRQSHIGWSHANLTTDRSTQTASHCWTMLIITGIHECVTKWGNYTS